MIQLPAPSNATDAIAKTLIESSFASVPAARLGPPKTLLPFLGPLQAAWASLVPDGYSGGRRERRFQGAIWAEDRSGIWAIPNNGYTQERSYNNLDGGKVRRFADIAPQLLENPLLRWLVAWNAQVADATGLLPAGKAIDVNLHQIRHHPTETEAAYSSPIWDHRDPETIVGLTLLDRTENLIGGDNLILTDRAHRGGLPRAVFQIRDPLDTYVITHRAVHQVTPMMAESETGSAHRDTLLVTFTPSIRTGSIERTINLADWASTI